MNQFPENGKNNGEVPQNPESENRELFPENPVTQPPVWENQPDPPELSSPFATPRVDETNSLPDTPAEKSTSPDLSMTAAFSPVREESAAPVPGNDSAQWTGPAPELPVAGGGRGYVPPLPTSGTPVYGSQPPYAQPPTRQPSYQPVQPPPYAQPPMQQPTYQQPYVQQPPGQNIPLWQPPYAGGVNLGPIPKRKNTGLRVFCIMMAVVLVLTGCLTVIYVTSDHNEVPGIESRNPFIDDENSESQGIYDTPSAPFVGEGDAGIDLQSKTPASDTVTAAVERAANSVVGIVVYDLDNTQMYGTATGIFISSDGYIVTNDHIYSGFADPKFRVYTYDGREFEAFYVAGDSRNDLAVLKIRGVSGFTPAVFANSDKLAVGESVIAIGNPGGMSLANTVTRGIVSAVNRRVVGNASYSIKTIQTDAAISPGNSGGPLVDMNGQVVGINSSKINMTGYEGIGFAVPSTTVKATVEDLIKYGSVQSRARLGITYTMIDSRIHDQTGQQIGLLISSISSDSDLYNRGIVGGDIITELNGKAVTSGDMVLDLIERSRPGEALKLTIYHNETGKIGEISVKLIADSGTSSYKNGASSSIPGNPFEE
ncbi:MAG: trypsin-like peptidase domain-containing protein [Oscillospiraceae bacterium]|jgi:serine protease Do|nr:trypsin-like peptidase domain-containing protein [Oscillospiraceae bacterium]